MGWLIDTNIAVCLRDGDASIADRINALPSLPSIAIISLIELENGVYAQPHLMTERRDALDFLLQALVVHDFGRPAAQAYREILMTAGYSRSRASDRMIAATAIAANLTLITLNGRDFRDIPNLKLETW